MSYHDLSVLLERLFARLNAVNAVPSADELWADYGQHINHLLGLDEIKDQFTDLGNGIQLPKAVEAARILRNLRQRFDANRGDKKLVERIRAAVVEKQRPAQNVARNTILSSEGVAGDIVKLAPDSFKQFSTFQVEGWKKVFNTINNRRGIAVVAPTGSGKTEVFLMPVIYAIAESICQNPDNPHRFIILYPRVALLEDQLERIFRYVFYAEQNIIAPAEGKIPVPGVRNTVNNKIVIGFQFGGVCSEPTGKDGTLGNRAIFDENRIFKKIKECPICGKGKLRAASKSLRNSGGIYPICCENCNAEFHTSIAKNDHASTRPHILVTTAESLDRLYLNPKSDFENYLRQITGIVFDEVHLYFSIYGVHVHNLINRLERLEEGQQLIKIAASATISDPERFVAKFFYGNENSSVSVHDASEQNNRGQFRYEQESAGLEVLYFLQSPQGQNNSGAAPTLIQSVMAMGHGVLKDDDRAIVFTDSLDMAGRFRQQISDAERTRRLWRWRIIPEELRFQNGTCTSNNPSNCPIYLAGECWRGILSSQFCSQSINGLRERSLKVISVSSKDQNDYRDGDIVVATPTLEVGVDDKKIKSTIHYLPPKTVFSFIQKRGRAGRETGEIAYTLMVLDTTASSQFYLFRRNRLINGNYELPLNPGNEVVLKMHELIEKERQRMVAHFKDAPGENARQGIWRWIWETLNRCHLISERYNKELLILNQFPRSREEQNNIRNSLTIWIKTEKKKLENDLKFERLIQEIRDKSPTTIQDIAQKIIELLDGFLSNQGVTIQKVGQKFQELDSGLGSCIDYSGEPDQQLIEEVTDLQCKVREAWRSFLSIHQQSSGMGLRQAKCFYDFFCTIERLYTEEKILNMASDAMKIVLQAMFYLHIGLNEGDEPAICQSRIEYYVPDAYFHTVKPIVVAVFPLEIDSLPQLKEESVTELSTTFIPYKPVYRYHPEQYLSVLDIQYDPAGVSDNGQTVTIRLNAEGANQGRVQIPRKVYIKPLCGDRQGQQIVRFCTQCYAIHDFYRTRCHCHANLRKVKLLADPIVFREYTPLVDSRRITRSFHILEKMEGITRVDGASVQAKYVKYDEERGYHILLRGQNNQIAFNAIYDQPIQYSIPTKGITWNLAEVVELILKDNNLSQQVKQVLVNREPKSLNEELVLHTAAHLLHKAIAAISGVNEQELEYWYNVSSREVVVWERYEGGAGISEIFENTLRTTQAEEVYQELLASVLCPVNLAERFQAEEISSNELEAELAQKWCLSKNDELISRVVKEADAESKLLEQQQNEEDRERLVCQENDGCPACIHTTYCTAKDQQVISVSRLVGEAILHCFVQRVNREDYEALINDAITQGITLPHTLFADPLEGVFDVLLL